MTSRPGKIGAALVIALGLAAMAGWWLGGQVRQNPVISPTATSPGNVEPDTIAPVTAPAAPIITLGPFAPPAPDAPFAPVTALPGAEPDAAGAGAQTVDKNASQTVASAQSSGAARRRRQAPAPPADLQPEAWARHAQASPANPDRLPLIAIVIDDLGIAPAATAAALALPAPMTMAVLPYANDAASVARKARALGHEVLVHLPMEPDNGQDPGPQALMAALSSGEFTRRLQWNLARLDGYVGINNHMGSRLTQNSAAMALLMAQIKRRGLLFLDSRTGARTLGASTARATGVTTLERDVFLDNVIAPELIRAQLQKTEDIARRKGFAIAIGHPHGVTVNALKAWAADIKTRGFVLAPLSAIARGAPTQWHAGAPLPGG